MKIIAKYIGGSQLYGLDTPESDVDYRGVFLTNDPAEAIGWKKDRVVDKREEGEDIVLYELKRFMGLLKKTNTQIIEALYVPQDRFIALDNTFIDILTLRENFIDSHKLLNSTRGYVKNETRLALGERTGRLGSKRKNSLEMFGFSPKNVSQIIRIVVAAEHFLKTGIYPLNIGHVDKESHDLAFRIKTRPQSLSLDYIESVVDYYDRRIVEAKDEINLSFNDGLAVQLIIKAYKNLLS